MKKETVVYLSSESVKLLVGTDDQKDMTKIYEYQEYPLAQGAVINGVITDEFEVKTVLKKLVDAGHTKVSLVIDSGQILSKSSIMPSMSKRHILQFVKDELLPLAGNSEDLIYDYAYLGSSDAGNGASQILCCGVERKFIANYMDVFKECGITIVKIDFSINILNKLTQELSGFEDKTYVITVLDGRNMTSVLFEKNQYKFSYRSRLVSEREESSYQDEIVANISQIYQFSKSGEKSEPLQNVLFCGLLDEEDSVKERIRESINIEAADFPTSRSIYVVNENEKGKFELDDYILLVGFLFKK